MREKKELACSLKDSLRALSSNTLFRASSQSLPELSRGGQWWYYDTARYSAGRSLERSLLQTQGSCGRGSYRRIRIGDIFVESIVPREPISHKRVATFRNHCEVFLERSPTQCYQITVRQLINFQ